MYGLSVVALGLEKQEKHKDINNNTNEDRDKYPSKKFVIHVGIILHALIMPGIEVGSSDFYLKLSTNTYLITTYSINSTIPQANKIIGFSYLLSI